MPEKKKKDPLQRKKRITEAAKSLFITKGYKQTTIDQIARNAGYSKRTVYLDYQNKDDLFISVAADGLEILYNKLKKIPSGKLSISEYIEKYSETIARFAFEHNEYFKMFSAEATPEMMENCSISTRSRAAKIEIDGFSLLAAEIDRAIAEGIVQMTDPWEMAGIFIGSVVGIILLSMGGSQIIFTKKALIAKVKKASQLKCIGLLSFTEKEKT